MWSGGLEAVGLGTEGSNTTPFTTSLISNRISCHLLRLKLEYLLQSWIFFLCNYHNLRGKKNLCDTFVTVERARQKENCKHGFKMDIMENKFLCFEHYSFDSRHKEHR